MKVLRYEYITRVSFAPAGEEFNPWLLNDT